MRLITVLFCWLSVLLLQPVQAAEDQALIATKENGSAALKQTNLVQLAPGPNEASISRVAATILERGHYLKQPFNDEVSSKFLDRYLDALDNLHIYFIQSDLKEFEAYRHSLDQLTKEGDTKPGRVVFLRFLERLQQQFDYVNELLKTEKFDFTTDEKFVINRRTLPRPKDLTEAKKLWRDRLRYEYLQEKLNKEKPDEIVKKITRRYTRILRVLKEYDNDDVLEIYLTSLAHVYDPHSDYMGKSSLDNFSINMKLSLYGIGAVLSSEDGYCKIQSLVPGGPADQSKKLKPNDKIIAVAQGTQEPVEVIDMKLNKVVEMIRGPKNTQVRLTVIPNDAPDPSQRKLVTLTRDEIKLKEQAAKASIIELPAGTNQLMRLGVIDLPSFYAAFELEGRANAGERKSTTTDVAKLLHKLVEEHVGGIVLDLRRNGGGSLEEAINLTGLFIKEGPVVQIKDSDGRISLDKDPDPNIYYDGPLIVLTSRFSASASEILAGALQDYGRALIVGDSSTHGKGTVQSLIQLQPYMRQFGLAVTNDPGAVKITIRKFYRASGSSTQLKGVVPDIVLPSVNNSLEVGESALENPLPWDTIPSATYDKMNRVAPFLTELKRRSDTRVGVDRDFVFIREEIDRYKQLQAEKSVSLNEALRWKEKNEADARAKARKKDLASRGEPPGKLYEITLENVNDPGLPPPTNFVKKAESSLRLQTPKKEKFKPDDTNKPSSDSEKPRSPDDEAEDAADDTPAVDITLDETKRILVDYIYLSLKNQALAGPVTTKAPDVKE